MGEVFLFVNSNDDDDDDDDDAEINAASTDTTIINDAVPSSTVDSIQEMLSLSLSLPIIILMWPNLGAVGIIILDTRSISQSLLLLLDRL